MQILVKLPESETETKEWALIEMQGELESRLGSGENLAGKFIGDLHFNKNDGTPVLIIGHHILNGKIVSIEKPLLVMRKKSTQDSSNGNDAMEVDVDPKNVSSEYLVEAVVRKKLLFKARPKPIIVVKK